MARTYLSGAYTMSEIGDDFGVHSMTVSRAVKEFEGTYQGLWVRMLESTQNQIPNLHHCFDSLAALPCRERL